MIPVGPQGCHLPFLGGLEQSWCGRVEKQPLLSSALLSTAGAWLQRNGAGLRNVSAGTQAGLGMPQAQQNPPQPGSVSQKAGGAPSSSCSVHVPSILWGCWCQFEVVQGPGMGPWGECVGCFLSLQQSHQQLGMWVPGFGTLGSAPSSATGMGDGGCVVTGKEVGRLNPHFPNPGAQSRIGQSSGVGACSVPGDQPAHLSAAALWLFFGPCWIYTPNAEWGDASVPLPTPQDTFQPEHPVSLLCLAGPAPAPPAWRPSSGNLQNSRLAGEGQACDVEQSPQNICLSIPAEPCQPNSKYTKLCCPAAMESGRSPLQG